jgi:hypothetical protein
MRFHPLAAPAALALAAAILPAVAADPGDAAPGDTAPKVVAFNAEARVALDAAGHPLSIEPSADLPDAVREFIRQRVATWRFSPPEQDGVTGPAVTYLHLGACAIPQADGNYRLAVDYRGNGPLYTNGPVLRPPPYPKGALIKRVGARADITYIVGTDGRATIENVEYSGNPHHRRDGFDAAVRDWMRDMRFEPEQLAGHPVRTRQSLWLTFSIAGKDFSDDKLRGELHEKAVKSEACRLAGGAAPEGLQSVALDSPVRIEPAG